MHAVAIRPYRGIAPGLLWLLAAILIFVASTSCRREVAVIDPGTRPAKTDGTITGKVSGHGGARPFEGRTVEAINVETGERHRVETSDDGGFRFKLKPGKYRVQLPLRQGEVLVRQPGVIHLSRADVDAHADFVLATTRISRPRGPAYRVDDGLGSPIA